MAGRRRVKKPRRLVSKEKRGENDFVGGRFPRLPEEGERVYLSRTQ
jgi:hypothetical protein